MTARHVVTVRVVFGGEQSPDPRQLDAFGDPAKLCGVLYQSRAAGRLRCDWPKGHDGPHGQWGYSGGPDDGPDAVTGGAP